ncbi:MAG: adenylate/guanylate cyclase domain-containing protein, partial [Sphingomonadaceae bacterium]|nr:adenylate/guanylate cyclase domain-containing protein [Sphingomonadaceae bacterium]
ARVAHSMIFADFAGFSQLSETALPVFAQSILGRMGHVLDNYCDGVLYRNSWGDALYAVIENPVDAAEIALNVQSELAEIPDVLKDCAGAHCGIRMGIHHGPIYRGYDAVTGRDSFYGTEVTRTARIEPVTPTGEVYATEAFAAILALETARRFGTHYVGRVQLHKGYGELAMYKLSRLSDVAR